MSDRGPDGTNQDREAAAVTDAMQALRRHDAHGAPGFAETLAAARRRAPARPGRWALVLAGGLLGGASGVAATAAVLLAAPAPDAAPAATATAVELRLEPVSLPRREPLRFLLVSPGRFVADAPRRTLAFDGDRP